MSKVCPRCGTYKSNRAKTCRPCASTLQAKRKKKEWIGDLQDRLLGVKYQNTGPVQPSLPRVKWLERPMPGAKQ